jgi:hypothetical protein
MDNNPLSSDRDAEKKRYSLHDRDAVEIRYPLIETREQIRYPLHDRDAEKLFSACDGGTEVQMDE